MAIAKRVTLFILVNLAMILTITLVMGLLGFGPRMRSYGLDYSSLAVFCLLWGMGGAFFSLALSRVMAKWMMGVQIIDPQNPGPYGDLVRTVHNLARAARLPAMPQVGIYQSPEVNAFATGPTKARALVAVSTGLLQTMQPNEVEGVLGHEITHVSNGDMVTLTLIQGIVNAFVMFLARIAAFALNQAMAGRDNRDDRPNPMMYWITTMLFEVVFGLIGAMIVAFFSRWREFRADAGGAKLAGRENMKAALQRLRSYAEQVDSSHPSLAAFKISGQRKGLMNLLASHPPLAERIARLEAGAR